MVFPPVEPPRTPWLLDAARSEPGEDLVAACADLEPGTVLAACQPPAPTTSVSVSPETGAASVTAPATSTIAVVPDAATGGGVSVVP